MKAEARFRALFVEAYPALQRYAHFRGVVGPDADDMVAEVLVVAWRRLDDVPADDPIPWLFAVARNVWRNGLRSTKRREHLLRRLHSPRAVESSTTTAEAPSGVQAALCTLSDDDQELLRLVAWDDLTPSQIAAVLGCTPGAARVRIHRARNRLATALEEDIDVPHR